MGHFKTKWQATPVLPRNIAGKFRMQRLPEAVAATREDRTFGEPPCVSDWDGWNITSDQVEPVPGLPVSYFVFPTSSTRLCEDECLEWVMETTCPDANVTITPDEDCVGVTVTFDDTEEALEDCTATLNAFVVGSGEQFGTTITLTPFPTRTFLYSDDAGVIGTDVTERIAGFECGFPWPGETWVVTSPDPSAYNTSLFAWNPSQTGSAFDWVEGFDGMGRPTITVFPLDPGDPSTMCGQEVRCDPTYNGDAANGPLSWTFDP